MARTIPSGSSILTLVPGVKTKELGSRRKSDTSEYYTIDDLIFTAVGDGASGNIGEFITMTNTDGAFDHLQYVYDTTSGDPVIPAGTSLEDLLRKILDPYKTVDIDITSISISYEESGGTWSAYAPVSSSNPVTLESGRGFKIQSVSYTIGDSSVITDNSVKLVRLNGNQITSIPNSDGTVTLDPIYSELDIEADSNGVSKGIRITATEVVDNGTNVSIQSAARQFNFYDRVRVGGSDVSTPASATLSTLLGDLNTYNALTIEKNLEFNGDADTDNEDNYFWVVYPQSWGLLDDILLGATSTLEGDFEAPYTASVTNSYGETKSHLLYRSSDKGGWGISQPITIKFTI